MKKYKTGGPLMESDRKPIDMRRKILGSDKDIVARGNRTPYEPTPKKGPEKPKQKLGRMGMAGFKSGGSTDRTPEQKRKLAEAQSKRGSESRGLDLRQEVAAVKSGARNMAGRALRAGDAGINALGGASLAGSGALGKLFGTKDSRNLERARGAFKDAGKSAKAVVMGEPKGEDIVSGRVKHRGADADWAKKEGKVMKKATKAGKAMVKKSAVCRWYRPQG